MGWSLIEKIASSGQQAFEKLGFAELTIIS